MAEEETEIWLYLRVSSNTGDSTKVEYIPEDTKLGNFHVLDCNSQLAGGGGF